VPIFPGDGADERGGLSLAPGSINRSLAKAGHVVEVSAGYLTYEDTLGWGTVPEYGARSGIARLLQLSSGERECLPEFTEI